jgi:sugar phosphate isomerase/epimerase
VTVKLAAQEHLLPGDSLEEKFEFAQSVGFDGIELRGFGDGVFASRAAELEAARAAGVVMPTVCVAYDRFIGDFDPDRRRQAREHMKVLLEGIVAAGGFGAITPAAFGLFSRKLPPFQPPRTPEEDRAVLLEELGALAEHAEAVGATLLLEPLNRYEDHMVNTVGAAADLVREIGSDALRVVADIYHMNIEEVDIADSLRQVAPYLAHIQLGDSNRLEPGAGHVDWSAILATLDEIGYTGWLAMECGISGPAEDVLPAVSALLKGGSR